ncbi:hypothetical protein EDB85DRAFT_2152307 [Lactarius pseudohatsudake]|nr:hypothetical protein EDB85DRAFT_2152307 [Lactarius pseudohatsudake]
MVKHGSNTFWSPIDEDTLLDYLWDHRSEAGEGMCFKAPTLTGAAAKVQETTTKGGPKTMGSCKNKWGKFKELYLVICDIKSQSGFTWSDEQGATIGPESTSVWEVYVKKKPGAERFRNKGWGHFYKVQRLMPSNARGQNIFRPSQEIPIDPRLLEGQDAGVIDRDSNKSFSDWEKTPPPSPSRASTSTAILDYSLVPATRLTSTSLKRRSPTSEPGSAASASTGRAPIRQRLTGAGALHGISSGLVEFNSIFRDGLESMANPGIDATPKRKKAAMTRVQELEDDLEDEQLLSIIDLFQVDVSAADTYMTLKREGLRKAWFPDTVPTSFLQ